MKKTISVLIPTYGRKKELMDTLLSLQDQTVLPDEIIVIDQNQPSFAEVDELCATLPRLRHIHSSMPGVVLNYNLALKYASSEIVLYLDDDVVPEKNLIEMHLNNYDINNIGGVAGRVEQSIGDQNPDNISQVGRYHRYSGAITTNFNAKSSTDVDIAHGCNMSFDRKVLLQIGGFDLGFNGNGYFFETDASLRIKQCGYKIVFDPKASLKHLMAPSGGARLKDKSAHTYFYIKNGIRLYLRHSPKWFFPVYVSRLVFYISAKSIYNRNLKIFRFGFKALWDGIINGA